MLIDVVGPSPLWAVAFPRKVDLGYIKELTEYEQERVGQYATAFLHISVSVPALASLNG